MNYKPKNLPDQLQTAPGSEYRMPPQGEVIRKTIEDRANLKRRLRSLPVEIQKLEDPLPMHFTMEGADISIIYLRKDKDTLKSTSLNI